MKLTIEDCIINIDESATREYYSAHPGYNSCACSGCKNYRKYCKHMSEEIKDFFRSCGIDDMRVIAEIMPFNTSNDGLLFYGGFYHLIGTISGGTVITQKIPCSESVKDENGRTIFIPTGYSIRTHTESEMISIGKNFSVFFKDEVELRCEGFPENAIQMNIEAHLPWIIGMKNTYY